MGHYKANLRDIEFNLFEVLALDKVLASGDYGELTGETVRDMLTEAVRQAEGPLAQPFSIADRHPPTFDPGTHSVTLPDEFKAAVRLWQGNEWPLIGVHQDIGGTPAPQPLTCAINELLFGSQPAVFFYLVGPAMLDVLYRNGNEQQKRWAALGVDRNWGATMVLTEPDAGSDVGAARTKAVDQGDGTWHIDGVKRFITSGDSDDLFENIAHLVLARPVGASSGSKGLSLFLVPKYLPDATTGEPGTRNGVFATGLEHKMGLTASATCELSFGQQGVPAVGWLVGDVHNGIVQMFQIMQFARMMVGIKSIATLSTGYLNALDFAKSRIQGPDITRMTDKTAPRVLIINHPDVRRLLMTQKAYAEGLRALYMFAAAHNDTTTAAIATGADPAMAARVYDLLLPVIKGVGSERGYQCLAESLQTLGGSGYLKDYPLEQYLRDAKIDSLYEGTTAIQAQDLLFRKIFRDNAGVLNFLLSRVADFLDNSPAPFSAGRVQLAQALDAVRAMAGDLVNYFVSAQNDLSQLYRIGLVSVPFMLALGDLLIGWLLLAHAEIARTALQEADATSADAAFYRGKIAAAEFFARTSLPRLTADRQVIANIDAEIMDLQALEF